MGLGSAFSAIFSPMLHAFLIFAGAAVAYAAVMIGLRPWRAANKDESAPLWKFLVLGFGFRLRRHQGLAAGCWAVLIASVLVAAVYHRIATVLVLTDVDGPLSGLVTTALLSDDPLILIPLEKEYPDRSCTVVQLAGPRDIPRCELATEAGQVALRMDGFDVTCEATCVGGGRVSMIWEYSRGPAPDATADSADEAEI